MKLQRLIEHNIAFQQSLGKGQKGSPGLKQFTRARIGNAESLTILLLLYVGSLHAIFYILPKILKYVGFYLNTHLNTIGRLYTLFGSVVYAFG